MLPRKIGRTLRILHEHHCADGRDCSAEETIERTIRGRNVSPPIIRIHDDGALEGCGTRGARPPRRSSFERTGRR